MNILLFKTIRLNNKVSYLISLLILSPIFLFAQPPGAANDWQLIFQDEFNGVVLDNLKWSRASKDLQLSDWQACKMSNLTPPGYPPYDDRNHIVSNGTLKLMVRKENVFCLDYNDNPQSPELVIKPYNYSSGMIKSIPTFKYGYFEIRCRLPIIPNGKKGAPLGPNFWMFGGDEYCGASGSEIDIFEYTYDGIPCIPNIPNCPYDDLESTSFPLNNYPHYKSNFHYTPVGGATQDDGLDNRHYHNDATDFHTYGFEWDCDIFKFYFDGVVTYTKLFHNNDFTNMNLIVDINAPIGGRQIDDLLTHFPYTYEIDFVKVYKKVIEVIPSSNFYTNINSTNSRYQYGNNFYSIAGNGNPLTVKNGGVLDVGARKGVVVNPPFIVEPGGFFNAQIKDYDNFCKLSDGALFDTIDGIKYGYKKGLDSEATESIGFTTSDINNSTIVSPNPNSGVFKISMPIIDDTVYLVNIVNSLGELVYSSKTLTENNDVNISSSGAGLFYLTIKYTSGKSVSKKIVIQ